MFSFLRFQISPSPPAFDFRSRLAGDRPFSQILAFRKSGFHLGPPVRKFACNLRKIPDSRRKHILFLEYSILLFYWKVFLGIFLFAFPPLIFSEESRIGATFETYNSRYLRNEKENWFFKTSNCPLKLKKPSEEFPSCRYAFFETRDGRPFFSVQLENRFGRASAGHRFRPLENFYFLRDNDFYTALPEIEQAIHRSAFVHLKFADWAFGSFYSEAEARKRGGYFLISPRRIFEFAYAPELGTHYASLDFKSKNFDLPGPKIVSRIQTFGIKKEWDGTFYTSVFSQRLDSEFRATGYRGKGRDLFAIDPDRGELDGKASLARFGITSHSYFSLEWIRAWKKSLPVEAPFPAFFPNSAAEPTSSDFRRWQIVGGKAPLYFGEFGGILFSLRNYNQGSSETLGRGLYYSLQKKNFSIEAGQEWRTNGDSITEGKWSFRLDESWNLEGAFLFQKEGNQTDSLFEARTARDETSLIFTDRNSSFRLRLLSPYIAFTVSHSRKKENKSDGIWINLQVQFPF